MEAGGAVALETEVESSVRHRAMAEAAAAQADRLRQQLQSEEEHGLATRTELQATAPYLVGQSQASLLGLADHGSMDPYLL